MLERRVLAQDRALELLQRSARLEPELVAQQLARVAVDRQRIRLPPRAVESQHQLTAYALLQRVCGAECLELRDQLDVTAEREIRVDPLHQRRKPQLFEPADLRLRELEQRQVGKRGTAPERKRFSQPRGRSRRVAQLECLAPFGDQALEQRSVEDRKSTRLNSSHTVISYAVFCLKKKKRKQIARKP